MREWSSHPYRSALDAEVVRAREIIVEMGQSVDWAITQAIAGLVERDVDLCNAVIDGDEKVNHLQYELRDLCFTIILTQAPVARDLREVMGFHHMAAELERMADHCVNIARIARELAGKPPTELVGALPQMAGLCAEQVRDMLTALMARDIEAARAVAGRDHAIDRLYRSIFDTLIAETIGDGSTAYQATRLIFVAHHLERIGDRVTNLGEDLIYLETGEVEELDRAWTTA